MRTGEGGRQSRFRGRALSANQIFAFPVFLALPMRYETGDGMGFVAIARLERFRFGVKEAA